MQNHSPAAKLIADLAAENTTELGLIEDPRLAAVQARNEEIQAIASVLAGKIGCCMDNRNPRMETPDSDDH